MSKKFPMENQKVSWVPEIEPSSELEDFFFFTESWPVNDLLPPSGLILHIV